MLRKWRVVALLLVLLAGAAACKQEPVVLPTQAVAEATVAPTATTDPGALPPTWTPLAEVTAPAVSNGPTFTPRPTRTPLILPTATATASRTPQATSSPTITPTPTPTPVPLVISENLLPNPSFEGGWYNANGIRELQIPEGWIFEFEHGENPLDPDPWNEWVQPEVKLLSTALLPPHEHDLFIWDGQHTLKVFKGWGAISFRLLTDVELTPGTYLFRVHIFPDLVDAYQESGTKVWAPDPLSGEVRFLVDGEGTPWRLPTFGQKNTFSHVFTVSETRTVRLGVAIRGPWAITNNGWFLDDWALYRVDS